MTRLTEAAGPRHLLAVNNDGMARQADTMTLQEAADRLGVHYMTAYRYVRTGRLPATRQGSQWVIDPRDLRQLRNSPRARSGERSRGDRSAALQARLMAGDEAGAWTVVEDALTSGLDPADVYLDLLVPALRGLGEGWVDGSLTVAQEHRASALAQRLIGRLGPRFARRGSKRGTVVIGAPAGDHHSLPGAIFADLLRGAGFEVLDMGSDAPAESFVETARQADRLVAVLVGVTNPGNDTSVRTTLRALRKAALDVPLLVGGSAIEGAEHARRVGADDWSGGDARAAIRAVEESAGLATASARS